VEARKAARQVLLDEIERMRKQEEESDKSRVTEEADAGADLFSKK